MNVLRNMADSAAVVPEGKEPRRLTIGESGLDLVRTDDQVALRPPGSEPGRSPTPPTVPLAEPTWGGKSRQEQHTRARNVKVSMTFDPTDEGDVDHIGPVVVDAHLATNERRRGRCARRPSPPQARLRRCGRDSSCMATRSTRSLESALRSAAASNSVVGHGAWQADIHEVLGPGCFEEWSACWTVYESLVLGLILESSEDHFTIANFGTYYEGVKALAAQFPDLCGLMRRAELAAGDWGISDASVVVLR